jgi:hypothetical protein
MKQMKKVLTIVALLFANISMCQMKFGVKAGGNISNIKIDVPVKTNAVLGYNFGAILQSTLTEKFFFQSELIYAVKGSKTTSASFAEGQQITLSYLNIPLLFGYKATNFIDLLGGVELGLMTNAKSKEASRSYDITKSFNKFDVGLDLGVAILPTNQLGIDIRYKHGLQNVGSILVNDQSSSIVVQKILNRSYQFTLFYLLSK